MGGRAVNRAIADRRIEVLKETLDERDQEISRLRLLVRTLSGRPQADIPPPEDFTAALRSAMSTTSPVRERAAWLTVSSDQPPALCILQGGKPDQAAETAIYQWLTARTTQASDDRRPTVFRSEDLPPRLLGVVFSTDAVISSNLKGMRARHVRDLARRSYRSRHRGTTIWSLLAGMLLLAIREAEIALPSALVPAAAVTSTAAVTASAATVIALHPSQAAHPTQDPPSTTAMSAPTSHAPDPKATSRSSTPKPSPTRTRTPHPARTAPATTKPPTASTTPPTASPAQPDPASTTPTPPAQPTPPTTPTPAPTTGPAPATVQRADATDQPDSGSTEKPPRTSRRPPGHPEP
ncbi:hypothetical protein [Actinomadura sp. K4S16]|uniref:hypothetical protein n=1 Tax=Actinomadura sp. K4S16 TaxID=1316147 RepID=UPI0011EF086B|nr:hypothetical protein [Actinomadura sp. K4S16]